MDKAIERVIDSQRFLILTTGNINDFVNMCGRFAIEGDTKGMEDWWYAQEEGKRIMAILSADEIADADQVFHFNNGNVGFKTL